MEIVEQGKLTRRQEQYLVFLVAATIVLFSTGMALAFACSISYNKVLKRCGGPGLTTPATTTPTTTTTTAATTTTATTEVTTTHHDLPTNVTT